MGFSYIIGGENDGPILAVYSLSCPWLTWVRVIRVAGLAWDRRKDWTVPQRWRCWSISCSSKSQTISGKVTGINLELGLGRAREKNPFPLPFWTLVYFFVLFLASKYWLVLASAHWLSWSFSYSYRRIRPMVSQWHSGNWARQRGNFFHQVCKVQSSNKGCHHISMFSAESHPLSVGIIFFYKCKLSHFK